MADFNGLPPPPRLETDDPNLMAIYTWMQDAFTFLQLTGQLSQDSSDEEIDPADLPDPANTSVALAQQTANDAYTIAVEARNLANSRAGKVGSVTVSGAATTGVVTWTGDDVQDDASYNVVFGAITLTGAPAANSTVIRSTAKLTTGFTITVAAAPGVGTDVTFDYQIQRN